MRYLSDPPLFRWSLTSLFLNTTPRRASNHFSPSWLFLYLPGIFWKLISLFLVSKKLQWLRMGDVVLFQEGQYGRLGWNLQKLLFDI